MYHVELKIPMRRAAITEVTWTPVVWLGVHGLVHLASLSYLYKVYIILYFKLYYINSIIYKVK
jgi:hypothetical protein